MALFYQNSDNFLKIIRVRLSHRITKVLLFRAKGEKQKITYFGASFSDKEGENCHGKCAKGSKRDFAFLSPVQRS